MDEIEAEDKANMGRVRKKSGVYRHQEVSGPLWKKFLSRKFIVAHEITILLAALPIVFTKIGVDNSVQMIALGGIVGIGTAYGILNVKDSKGQ